jgi:hypothetical protein
MTNLFFARVRQAAGRLPVASDTDVKSLAAEVAILRSDVTRLLTLVESLAKAP